jgi:S-adenosyl methyltransferase
MTSDEAAPNGGVTGGPPAFDISVANQARIYDYLLGGKDNYAADREAAEATLKIYPEMALTARANRAFLGRAVRYLASEAGIRQFLDIGTGIPTASNTHQVAQAIAPETRVVYVDYDPIVLAHARALLISHTTGATDYIDADLRDTDTILHEAAQLLDFAKPVAVMLLAVLHVIPDADDPYGVVATLMDAVPSGSYLVISHPASDLLSREAKDGLEDLSHKMMQQKVTSRSREQVARFFDGMDLGNPGWCGSGNGAQTPAAPRASRPDGARWAANADTRLASARWSSSAARSSPWPRVSDGGCWTLALSPW